MLDSSSTKSSTVLHAIALTIAVALIAALQPRLGWKPTNPITAGPASLSAPLPSPPTQAELLSR